MLSLFLIPGLVLATPATSEVPCISVALGQSPDVSPRLVRELFGDDCFYLGLHYGASMDCYKRSWIEWSGVKPPYRLTGASWSCCAFELQIEWE
jgi:hypothetical protein